MRAPSHPNIEDVTVEGILHAFSDPVRIKIFMDLACAESTKICNNFVNASSKPIAKSTLSQHFKVLREAGLIYSERKGIELHNRTRCAELRERFGEMIGAILTAYAAQQKKKKASRQRT